VQEVSPDAPGVRVLVVKTGERLAYGRTEPQKAMVRVRVDLDALQRRVEQGRLMAPAKVGAATARILRRYHGDRYFGWAYHEGHFQFSQHPGYHPKEEAGEGTYDLQTTEANLTSLLAMPLYKGLREVEGAICSLKDVIELRPFYYRTDHRVAAHVFVTALAFLLHRALAKKLKEVGSVCPPRRRSARFAGSRSSWGPGTPSGPSPAGPLGRPRSSLRSGSRALILRARPRRWPGSRSDNRPDRPHRYRWVADQ